MNTSPSSRDTARSASAVRWRRWGAAALVPVMAAALLTVCGLTVGASAAQSAQPVQDPTPPILQPLIVPGGGSGALVTDLVLPGTPFILHWFAPNSDPSRAVAWGDVDNDGDLDLAVANYGKPNRVYINDDGVLLTDPARVWQSDEQSDRTTSLAWGDINGDGYLDLVVGNQPECNASRFFRSFCIEGEAAQIACI